MMISASFILWHDLRVVARMTLSLCGFFFLLLLQCLFLWALFSVVLGWTDFSLHVAVICAGVPAYLFIRILIKMDLSKRTWRDSLPDYETVPKISRVGLSAQDSGISRDTRESGIELVFFAAPLMFRSVIDEMRKFILPTRRESAALEREREHLAARNSWELLRDFESREEEIRKLAALEMVTVRKISGVWSLRVSLKGQHKDASCF